MSPTCLRLDKSNHWNLTGDVKNISLDYINLVSNEIESVAIITWTSPDNVHTAKSGGSWCLESGQKGWAYVIERLYKFKDTVLPLFLFPCRKNKQIFFQEIYKFVIYFTFISFQYHRSSFYSLFQGEAVHCHRSDRTLWNFRANCLHWRHVWTFYGILFIKSGRTYLLYFHSTLL